MPVDKLAPQMQLNCIIAPIDFVLDFKMYRYLVASLLSFTLGSLRVCDITLAGALAFSRWAVAVGRVLQELSTWPQEEGSWYHLETAIY